MRLTARRFAPWFLRLLLPFAAVLLCLPLRAGGRPADRRLAARASALGAPARLGLAGRARCAAPRRDALYGAAYDLFAGLLFCQALMRGLFARYAARWRVQTVADVASLPLLAAVFSVFKLLATPAFDAIVRTEEIEADRFGLHLARDPHGFAEVMLTLADYRKPDPGALEEFVFFHHPSARHRIHDAMRWREAMGTP